MKANLIISLDCEGKWGLYNKPKLIKNFTNKNLLETYIKIQNLFDQYNIRATYSFVLAFVLNKDEKKNFDCFFFQDKAYSQSLKYYLNLNSIEKNEGWFLPEVLNLTNNNYNEISCHSFSHLAFEKKCPEKKILLELDNCKKVESIKKIKLSTFIYPYNIAGYEHLLKKHNFLGYRHHNINKRNMISRLKNFFQEYNLNQSVNNTNSLIDRNKLVKIPGGYFLNWRWGIRKIFIPKLITTFRWKNLLRNTIKNNETLNLWFHPHNLISAPETFVVFKKIIEEAIKLRDKGLLNIITQKDYVDNIISKTIYE